MPIQNYVELVRTDPRFNTLQIGELLFSEYTCPTTDRFFKAWSELDYVIHTLSGKKTMHAPEVSVTLRGGDTMLVKKGGGKLEQFFEQDFCLIVCFLPDGFVKEIVAEMSDELASLSSTASGDSPFLPVQDDPAIAGYFQSLRAYFSGREAPSEALLRVKLRELVVGLLFSRNNPEISSYLRSLGEEGGPSLERIMEANFMYNLSLEEYARLCHRSLSSFKREFSRQFDETPGKWLLNRRLDFAAELIRNKGRNVTEAAFDSGFEDVSHFSRAFKRKFGESPSKLRAEGAAAG